MPDAIKLKTGTIAKLSQGVEQVPLERGSILFAVDTTNNVGQIAYDAPNGEGTKRIIMSTQAGQAESLATNRAIDGVNFNGSAAVSHYGQCSTAAATAAKTVDCANFVLTTGSRIIVKYSNTNTASNPTLNVNSTGAKAIYYHNSLITPSALTANEVHEYIYDGTNWNYVGTIASNVAISIDESVQTLYITSPTVNGDGVSY